MKRNYPARTNKPLSLQAQVGLAVLVVGLLSVGGYFAVSALEQQPESAVVQVNVLELWNSGSYDQILVHAQEELKRTPLEPSALIFRGFAAFHKGVAEPTIEKKLPLINEAIVQLRKALLINDIPLKAEVHYILGKAYFHKGKFYADLAVQYLLRARDLGYEAPDMNEYLGLAYSLVGRFSEASDFFLKAVATAPSDLLLWTLGQTYFQMERYDDAIQYLSQSIDKTQDRALEQRCRFLLGEIFTKTKRWAEAQAEYETILAKNPNSADAHYYLGEIAFAQGNKTLARSEWVKAFKIDPLHFNANQRLFNNG